MCERPKPRDNKQKQESQAAHKRHRAVVNNNHNNNRNRQTPAMVETNNLVKAQIIPTMVGSQGTKMDRLKAPVRAVVRVVVAAAVVMVTAVVIAVIPTGVLLTPATAKPSTMQ
jgi:hypothetical protein